MQRKITIQDVIEDFDNPEVWSKKFYAKYFAKIAKHLDRLKMPDNLEAHQKFFMLVHGFFAKSTAHDKLIRHEGLLQGMTDAIDNYSADSGQVAAILENLQSKFVSIRDGLISRNENQEGHLASIQLPELIKALDQFIKEFFVKSLADEKTADVKPPLPKVVDQKPLSPLQQLQKSAFTLWKKKVDELKSNSHDKRRAECAKYQMIGKLAETIEPLLSAYLKYGAKSTEYALRIHLQSIVESFYKEYCGDKPIDSRAANWFTGVTTYYQLCNLATEVFNLPRQDSESLQLQQLFDAELSTLPMECNVELCYLKMRQFLHEKVIKPAVVQHSWLDWFSRKKENILSPARIKLNELIIKHPLIIEDPIHSADQKPMINHQQQN